MHRCCPLHTPSLCVIMSEKLLLFSDIFTSRVSNFLRYTPFEVRCSLRWRMCLLGGDVPAVDGTALARSRLHLR